LRSLKDRCSETPLFLSNSQSLIKFQFPQYGTYDNQGSWLCSRNTPHWTKEFYSRCERRVKNTNPSCAPKLMSTIRRPSWASHHWRRWRRCPQGRNCDPTPRRRRDPHPVLRRNAHSQWQRRSQWILPNQRLGIH
jgi:hypothetical protein